MEFGWEWKEEDMAWIPVMTTIPSACEAIIHLVKCRCVKERCTTKRCQCRKTEMNCTDLCGCYNTGKDCENMPEDVSGDNDDEDHRNNDDDDDKAEYEYIPDSDDNLDSEFG